MTIRFTNDWQGFKEGMTRSLGSALESVAVGARVAVYVVDAPEAPVDVRADPVTGGLVGPDGRPIPGLVSGAGNRVQSRGIVVSMMDGARGETVAVASTPASGAWEAMSLPRLGASRRITIPTQNTGGTIQINAPAGRSFGRLTPGSSVTVLLYLEAINADDTMTVTVSPDGMANGGNSTRALSVNRAPGFWYETIDASQFVGTGAPPINVNSFRVRFARANTAGVTTQAHVCGIIVNQRTKPTLLIDLDDGFDTQYSVAYPVMSSYGLVGSIAVIAQTVGKSAGQVDAFDYASLAQLQEMQRSGWGMLVHGYYPHNQAGTMNSYANILADVRANQDYVATNLPGAGKAHYVLPAGQQHAETDRVMRELGFETCRSTASLLQTELPDGVDNPMRLASMGVSASRGLANLKAEYDRLRKLGGTLRLCGHRFPAAVTDAGNELSVTDWEDLCAYMAPSIQSGEVLNVTSPDWWLMRNR